MHPQHGLTNPVPAPDRRCGFHHDAHGSSRAHHDQLSVAASLNQPARENTPGRLDPHHRGSQVDYPMFCFFDKGRISKQILRVCHIGDRCIVSAKGGSGNRNGHVILKVFEVQRGQKIDPLPDKAE